MRVCSVAGCGSRNKGRGLCAAHYRRWWRHGDPLKGRPAWGVPRKWLKSHKDYDDDECLIWPFSRLVSGYPSVRIDGKLHIASRVMCELVNGAPPHVWYEAAHSCGNGRGGCVHPRHLRWATPKDNRGDMVQHGTAIRGSKQYKAKLTEEDVRYIRSQRGLIPQVRLAERFGVGPSSISRVISRTDWAWLND